MGKFIKLVGVDHHHDAPQVLGFGQPMSRRHTGSLWECECGAVLEWDGKNWSL